MSCRLCPGSRQGLDRRLRFVRRTARQVALRQIVARPARRPCRDLPQSARQRRFLFACPALCARLWPLLPASAGMRVRPAAGTASRGDVKKIDVSPEAGRSVSRKWTRRGYHGGRGSIRPGVLVQDAVRDFRRLRAQRRRQGPAEALAGSSRPDACQSLGQLLRTLARSLGMSTGMSLIRPSVRGKVRRSIRPSRPASKAASSCYETGTFFAMFMAGMGTGKCPFSQDS
jgi:hypothetical protein